MATESNSQGEPVSVDDVQAGLDRLASGEEVEVSAESLGYRSAFVAAVLASVPGAVVLDSRPKHLVQFARRVR